jgi:ribose transport system permease protein
MTIHTKDTTLSPTTQKLRRALPYTATSQSFWIVLVLVAICVFFSVVAGGTFLSTNNVSLISQNVAVWAVIGVGMTFVIITGGIDLSVGSVLVFSSVLAAKATQLGGGGTAGTLLGVLAAVGSGAFWGALNGVLISKKNLPPLIVTLGTLSVALGLAQVITGGVDIRDIPGEITDFGLYTRIAGIPAVTFTAILIVIVGALVLHKTTYGRYTFAIGSSCLAARRVGINTDLHLMSVYVLSGCLAGLAGMLSLAQFGTTTLSGQSLTNLNVIAAVVIGGTSIFGGEGSMVGTVVGLFIPATLQAGFVIVGVEPFWQGVAVGAVLIGAVYFDQSTRAAAQRSRGPRGLPYRLWHRHYRKEST